MSRPHLTILIPPATAPLPLQNSTPSSPPSLPGMPTPPSPSTPNSPEFESENTGPESPGLHQCVEVLLATSLKQISRQWKDFASDASSNKYGDGMEEGDGGSTESERTSPKGEHDSADEEESAEMGTPGSSADNHEEYATENLIPRREESGHGESAEWDEPTSTFAPRKEKETDHSAYQDEADEPDYFPSSPSSSSIYSRPTNPTPSPIATPRVPSTECTNSARYKVDLPRHDNLSTHTDLHSPPAYPTPVSEHSASLTKNESESQSTSTGSTPSISAADPAVLQTVLLHGAESRGWRGRGKGRRTVGGTQVGGSLSLANSPSSNSDSSFSSFSSSSFSSSSSSSDSFTFSSSSPFSPSSDSSDSLDPSSDLDADSNSSSDSSSDSDSDSSSDSSSEASDDALPHPFAAWHAEEYREIASWLYERIYHDGRAGYEWYAGEEWWEREVETERVGFG